MRVLGPAPLLPRCLLAGICPISFCLSWARSTSFPSGPSSCMLGDTEMQLRAPVLAWEGRRRTTGLFWGHPRAADASQVQHPRRRRSPRVWCPPWSCSTASPRRCEAQVPGADLTRGPTTGPFSCKPNASSALGRLSEGCSKRVRNR